MVLKAFSGLISAIWNFLSSIFRYSMHLQGEKNAVSQRTSQPPSTPHSRLFALVIGINDYATATKLRGAVADADAIVEYLEAHLNVPSRQIRILRNQQASRIAIIQALRELRNDTRIHYGDPIMIYYAGLGARWHSTSSIDPTPSVYKTEYIIPQDYICLSGKKVDPIPDRTIQALIEAIARDKGDNIMMILDCSHSVPGIRDEENVQTNRSVVLSNDISTNVDSDIWETQGAQDAESLSGFAQSGLRSHVLLAACSQDEFAHETTAGGLFTHALLRLLKTTNSEKLSYADILKYLDAIPGQNPRCEGQNQNCFLFNGKVSIAISAHYPMQIGADNQYFIEVSSTQRISFGAEFTIYPEKEAKSNPLGVLAVDNDNRTFPSRTILSYKPGDHFHIPLPSFASQTRLGEKDELILHIPELVTSLFEAATEQMQRRNSSTYKILLVGGEKSGLAKLSVTAESENDHILFEITDHLVRAYGLTRIPFLVERTPTALCPVLHAAAHFYGHLDRSHPNKLLQNKIRVNFYRLRSSDTEYDEEGRPCLYPVGPNLCRGNLIVDFSVAPGALYGVEIINDTSFDLYPSVFFFNNSDISIDAWYTPPTSHEPRRDVPLPRNGGSLTVGYGSGDSLPYEFSMKEGQTVDVGFLKVFLTTKPVDLSKIALASPFEVHNHDNPLETARIRVDIWGTILVPVIQRR